MLGRALAQPRCDAEDARRAAVDGDATGVPKTQDFRVVVLVAYGGERQLATATGRGRVARGGGSGRQCVLSLIFPEASAHDWVGAAAEACRPHKALSWRSASASCRGWSPLAQLIRAPNLHRRSAAWPPLVVELARRLVTVCSKRLPPICTSVILGRTSAHFVAELRGS